MKTNKIVYIILSVILSACSGEEQKSDAYGNFEAKEYLVSSLVSGKLLNGDFDEGEQLSKGDTIAIVDTTQLTLKKKQMEVQKSIIKSKAGTVLSQIKVFEEQLNSLQVEYARVQKLVADSAAPTRQLDELDGKVKVVKQQMQAIKVQNSSVLKELELVDVQLLQLQDQLDECYIKAPVTGTVLQKYIEESEIVAPGKLICKIADLSSMELKAYISGDMLSAVNLNDKVEVLIDAQDGKTISMDGQVSWISSSAEFTPKIIQTKEERVNLVYAVKVLVKNDGKIKIGMPGEMNIKSSTEQNI
ncbi:MAG: HlyD family secretion protein [Marinilabiliales bacterium]|nr:MAG: HlyD family secretion protein [Marinilabiliales bacterium]